MNKEQGIKHLLCAVKDIDEASNYFREYLNSGSKEFWDQYVISSFFSLSLCQICDNNLLAVEDCKIVESCIYFHREIKKYNDFSPEQRNRQEKVLEILWEVKKVIYPLTSKLLKENKVTDKETVSLECDALLKNPRFQI